jgi:hypothetical protein
MAKATTPTGEAASTADLPRSSARRQWLERTWIVTVVVFTLARLLVARATLAERGLNIWIFGIIDLATAFPYALGIARVVEAVVDRDGHALGRWTLVAGASFIAPYCYIAWAGAEEGFPTQVYVVLGVLIAIFGANAIWGVLRKIRAAREENGQTAGKGDGTSLATSPSRP